MAQKEIMEQQDIRKLDVTKLHPLSPEVISRQPTINIGNFFEDFVTHSLLIISRLKYFKFQFVRPHWPCSTWKNNPCQSNLWYPGSHTLLLCLQTFQHFWFGIIFFYMELFVCFMSSNFQTTRFKCELERNITVKLGYANAKIYKCEDESCPQPLCYMYVC